MVRSALLLVALSLVAGKVWAQPRCDVLVANVGGDADVFSPRLLAELAAAGLTARTRTSLDEPLDALARKDSCLSVVRPLPSGKGVEVWLNESANGRPMVRNLVVDERPGGPEVAMVVLQTTELLRAALQGQPPTSSQLAVGEVHQAAAPDSVSKARQPFSLGAGVGVLKQRGGFPALPVLRVEAAWPLWRGVGPELLLQGPWQTTALQTLEGTTKATPWSAALGLRLDHTFARWFAEVGAGVLWQIWHVEGFANSSVIASDHTFSQLGIYSRARAGINVASWLRCGFEIAGAANFSETRIAHAQRDVGAVGQLGAAAFVMIEALSL